MHLTNAAGNYFSDSSVVDMSYVQGRCFSTWLRWQVTDSLTLTSVTVVMLRVGLDPPDYHSR